MSIYDLVSQYIKKGYHNEDAVSKVAQDIILFKISKSKFSSHITIKGGVVMHNISNNMRRATRDLDMDFIRYSLDDDSIIKFINKLNTVDDGIMIKINGGIEKLHHQDYDGKRIYIVLKDKNDFSIKSKLDIGVHKMFEIEQDDYCFDLSLINESVNLLINSREQIFVEKMKSLLKFGAISTRYKDIFDFYYLINESNLNGDKLVKYINILIFKDTNMYENNLKNIVERLKVILNNKTYRKRLNSANNNWLELPIDDVIEKVIIYIESLEKVTV